jgi:hypothetical protein
MLSLKAGLDHLEGDLAVFTDDDALPYPDWLMRLRAAADAHPEYSMFGGCTAALGVPLPDWIRWVDARIASAITDPQMAEGPQASRCFLDRTWPNGADTEIGWAGT